LGESQGQDSREASAKIEILDEAEADLIEGYHFYEAQADGLGSYFLDSLFSDIDSLLIHAGLHAVVFGCRRCLSKRFPFAVYYSVDGELIRVHAVLDCRRNPSWTLTRLTKLRRPARIRQNRIVEVRRMGSVPGGDGEGSRPIAEVGWILNARMAETRSS